MGLQLVVDGLRWLRVDLWVLAGGCWLAFGFGSCFGIRANFRSIQYNRRQPRESQTIKRAKQPRMTLPFKYLPHEILNKPKPAPAIRVYPAAPHEFFIPKPTEKPVTPPKPVTTIRARL
nr:hypothetical protein CFP56_78635 [Quercus suber]